jgi:hypothetical protein
MAAFWLAPALAFLPPPSKVFGVWGLTLPAWILHDPGCTGGASPLFPYMKTYGVGIGIWEWWDGDPSPIVNLIKQIHQ